MGSGEGLPCLCMRKRRSILRRLDIGPSGVRRYILSARLRSAIVSHLPDGGREAAMNADTDQWQASPSSVGDSVGGRRAVVHGCQSILRIAGSVERLCCRCNNDTAVCRQGCHRNLMMVLVMGIASRVMRLKRTTTPLSFTSIFTLSTYNPQFLFVLAYMLSSKPPPLCQRR